MSKILRLGKTPSDNQTGSSGGAAVTKNISGEYNAFNDPNASLTIGTAGSGNNLFLWGTNSSEENVEQQIADLASALGVTTANLVGVSITSPNLPAGATIRGVGRWNRGYTNGIIPAIWASSALTGSASGTVTFGGIVSASSITARLPAASTTKSITGFKAINDYKFRVINADGVGTCQLTASAPGAGEMSMIATDSTGNTYYVTRLHENHAWITRKTGSSYQFASGKKVKWNEIAAVAGTTVKI